jgi:hypothetical protein
MRRRSLWHHEPSKPQNIISMLTEASFRRSRAAFRKARRLPRPAPFIQSKVKFIYFFHSFFFSVFSF